VVVVPWLAFFLFVMIWDNLRRYYSPMPNLDDFLAAFIWFGFQVIPALILGGHARLRLRWSFRQLATQPIKAPWWRRILSPARPPHPPLHRQD
jgi:hypothetical protein